MPPVPVVDLAHSAGRFFSGREKEAKVGAPFVRHRLGVALYFCACFAEETVVCVFSQKKRARMNFRATQEHRFPEPDPRHLIVDGHAVPVERAQTDVVPEERERERERRRT